MNAVRFATIPLGFDKTSTKTWKNNGCFSRGPLQGVTPPSLIS